MVNRAKSLSHIGKRSVLLSVIALFEIAALVVVACFSWIENGPAELEADQFVIRSGYGFNFFNEDGEAVDELIIKADGQLSDCSTIDGRRLYFPILGEANGKSDEPSVIKDGSKLTYRAATEIDQEKYIKVEFQVISVADNDIEVYVDPTSYIKNSESNLVAARVTFNQNDGTAPVTICPGDTQRSNKYLKIDTETQRAVPSDGDATYQPMNAVYKTDGVENKSKYQKVFTLPKNKVKTISMTVWLDGFDEMCKDSIVGDKNTSMLIKFGVRNKTNTNS